MDTYEEAVRFIDQVYKYGSHPGSENAAHLLELLGHPETSMKIIHVAGTNGKGSVCAFLADMLTACGYRMGLFISPHLVDIRERIQLNRSIISREDFLTAFHEVADAVQRLSENGYTGITYFDYLFAIAMCYFAHTGAEYVVMETGLGGLYDSTNAVKHPVLTIITSVSMDHTEVLGDTLGKIARQKAGILKPGVPLIYCADEPEVCEVIAAEAKKKQVPCLGISRQDCRLLSLNEGMLRFEFHLKNQPAVILTVNSIALYQMENASIAYAAALLLQHPEASFRLLFNEQSEILKKALAHSCWEGRMEQVASEIYIDGAHNADGIRMLLDTLNMQIVSQESAKARPGILLFTAVREKDTDRMIQEICESGLFRRYILTSLNSPRAIPAKQLKAQFEQYTSLPIDIYDTPWQAFLYGTSIRQEGEIFLTAGSLYLVGTIKENLLKQETEIK